MESPSTLANQHIPSFVQNSCTGNGASERGDNKDLSLNSCENPMRPKMSGISEDREDRREARMAEQAETEKEGCTRSLLLFPSF